MTQPSLTQRFGKAIEVPSALKVFTKRNRIETFSKKGDVTIYFPTIKTLEASRIMLARFTAVRAPIRNAHLGEECAFSMRAKSFKRRFVPKAP